MDHAPCIRRTLSRGDFALVERCNCGAVHVTIGAVTFRLAPNALAPLADTLCDAVVADSIDLARAMRAESQVLS